MTPKAALALHQDSELTAGEVFAFPASFSQQRLWFLDQFDSESTAYHEPFAYRLRGPLNRRALEHAITEIVARHEVLRTSLTVEGGALVQLVQPPTRVELPIEDLSGARRDPAVLQRRMLDEVHRPFNLAAAPMVRARLFRLAETEHVLLVTMHHVACDGWSVVLFFNELQALYGAFRRGDASPLLDPPIQYADYTVWQREWLEGDELARQADYWKRQLAGLGAVELPADRPRPPRQTYRGARMPFTVSGALTSSLKSVGLRENATLFMTLMAAFQVLVHRYTGQQDIPIGTPTAGRERPELEGLVGCFVNMLVMRGDLSARPTFAELLRRTRDTGLGAYAHPDLPFEQLVELVQTDRDVSRSPLFQIMFAMQAPAAPVIFDGLEVVAEPIAIDTSKYDLSLFLGEDGRQLRGWFEYNTDLFDASTIQRLIGHFLMLLEGIAANPDGAVADLPLLTAAEQSQMLVDWNRTEADYPRDRTVAQLVEAQAARTPDRVAVAYDDRTLTYHSLNARANALAATLETLGVGPAVLVGICMERSPEMVVGLLAILKAGGTYVPLDPAFPADRLAFMLEDSRASVLLTETKLRGLIPADRVQVICLDTLGTSDDADAPNPVATAGPDDLAYVLYTSGSTGKPKGVEIPHAALTNFLVAMQCEPGCTADDTLLAVTTLSFDIAGLELYLPLISGGRVELVSRAVAADGRRLKERIELVSPTILQATPATWRMLIDAGWQGTPRLKALIGGEALPADLVGPLLARSESLWNMYGPTETTIWSSVQRIADPREEITVGRPIANTTFYVLDSGLHPVPIGVPGELFIGGDGLARGYRQRPDLTADRFIPHPVMDTPGARLYRTGDLARYRPDGRVVHLGRLDHQVKVRGFRIELGEIEAALVTHPSVAQAVVTVRQDRPGDGTLAGYVILAPGQSAGAADLRQHLRGTLPEYMVPQHLMPLEAFPLTPNGKIDRKRLPAPHADPLGDKGFVALRTPTEQALAAIWCSLLGVPRVGARDDFFELGGHSLKAVELMTRVADTFQVDIPLQALFEAATLEKLADRIAATTGQPRVSSSDGERIEPRTATERRLASIWEQILGSPAGVHDSFLACQGNRDLLETMLAEVRRAFGAFAEGLPVPDFLRTPTIENLARLLDGTTDAASSLVVCLQPNGSKRPLFLLHAGGGYVFFYRALASRLGPDRPVYAVRAETEADNLGTPFDTSHSIEALATRYIAEIKTVQPNGPYSLGGGCVGGVLAYEIARQLEARGEEVAGPVLLFDAFVLNNPDADARAAENVRAHLQVLLYGKDALKRERALLIDRVQIHLRRLRSLGPAESVRYAVGLLRNLPEIGGKVVAALAQKLRPSTASAPAGTEPAPAVATEDRQESAQLQVMARFLNNAMEMLKTYTPRPYGGRLVVFKAADGKNPGPLWTGLGSGHDTEVLPGTHLEMLEEPVVADTAALTVQYLDHV